MKRGVVLITAAFFVGCSQAEKPVQDSAGIAGGSPGGAMSAAPQVPVGAGAAVVATSVVSVAPVQQIVLSVPLASPNSRMSSPATVQSLPQPPTSQQQAVARSNGIPLVTGSTVRYRAVTRVSVSTRQTSGRSLSDRQRAAIAIAVKRGGFGASGRARSAGS